MRRWRGSTSTENHPTGSSASSIQATATFSTCRWARSDHGRLSCHEGEKRSVWKRFLPLFVPFVASPHIPSPIGLEHLMATVHRVYNFSAGPAVLPMPVLEEIQRDLVALPGVGMSILEISHRSAAFEA